ncbi:MAG: c-type cytochrome biogenesis protein CcmI [Rhodoferax sp.]|nr:c-type cytochrome biogenesis protein CcmI [Rhodoferax sp.]MCF8209513.1 c-type cytochrome biogenesis protein CcmI [Rhodoferax sp.]
MIAFVAAGALIVALALALLFRPFYWKSTGTEVSRRQLNAVIYRDQMTRLERDRDEKMIAQDDYEQARAELQHRLLEEASVADSQVTLHAPRKTMLFVGLALPGLAIAIYLMIGNPSTIGASGPQHQVSTSELNTMIEGLARKLEKEPENFKGWAMLARSYKAIGRNAEAEQAFARAGTVLDSDAQLLADYADVMATNARGNLAGKPTELIEKALKVEPNNGMALWLYGTAAFQRGDFEVAARTWENLVQQLTPGSEDEQMLSNAIKDAYAKLGKSAPTLASRPAAPAAGSKAGAKTAAASAQASVSGVIEIDPALKARALPTDIVMVIARLPGTRMPIAVLRAPATQLPLQFTLDDSLAMNPQALISNAAEVEVEVRISKTGMAMPEPGDLLSAAQTVKVGASGLKMRVDRVRP